MIISLLLRSTLLLLVVNHSIAQEWYTQDNYGPEFYSPSMVKDTPPSFLEKREAEISANESKLVYLPDYVSNIRQKRDLDDADNEQHSSDVTEYIPNDVLNDVDELSENNAQSVHPNSSPDTNDQRVTNNSYDYANSDTSNSYEYPQGDANSDANSEVNSEVNSDTNGDVNSDTNSDADSDANTVTSSVTNSDVNSNVNGDINSDVNSGVNSDGNIVTSNVTNSDANSEFNNEFNSDTRSETNFYGNERTARRNDRSNDVMDERDEPTNHAETSDTKTAGNHEVIQEGSGESSFQADDSHTINKEENAIKPQREHIVDADESNQRKIVQKEQENKTATATSSSSSSSTTTTTTTSPNESGSGSFRRNEEDDDNDDDDDDDNDDDDDEWVKGDEDEDKDEQLVKRQNLGMKLM